MFWPAEHLWSAKQFRVGYHAPRTWMGSLITESRDASGLYYRRNRFYDSETGQFTQEDPIGIAGGLNVYGFADGDPVNHHDPFGLACQKKSSDHLVCTDLGAGDAETVRDFLGGAAGASAYETLRSNPQLRSENCRGGWGAADCMRLSNAVSGLILHPRNACSVMGTRVARRLQRRRLLPASWLGDNAAGVAVGLLSPIAPLRIVLINPTEIRDSAGAMELLAHEEHHMWYPQTGLFPPNGDRFSHSATYRFGESCRP